MKRRAAVIQADPSSAAAEEGRPWIALVGEGPVPIRRGIAPMLLRAMGSLGRPDWSFHPTHAAALAHAIAAVGLDKHPAHREAP